MSCVEGGVKVLLLRFLTEGVGVVLSDGTGDGFLLFVVELL